MTINQMQYFSTVCTYHNITTSAKVLFISQPALSSALADLEEEVGCQLLNRTNKGVVPTPEGARLLEHINNVLSRYRLMEEELPEIVRCQNMVSVGFRPYSGEEQMMRLYSEFCKKYPNVDVALHEMRNNHPFLFLDEGQLDVLATTVRSLPDGWEKKYEFIKLQQDHMRIFCHKLNPMAQKEKVGLQDLENQTVAFWEGHKPTRDRLKIAMESRGLNLKTLVLPQVSGIANLICNNAAVGLLRGEFAEHIDIIHGCEIKEELWQVFLQPYVDIYLVWRKEIERYPVKKQFIDYAIRWARSQETE